MSPLPAPDPAALEYSEKAAALIKGEIEAAGGWIPFSRFMELALYAPGLGYYSAGMHKFGAAGDFVTAPEISALFGQTLAQQAAQVLRLTAGNILEIGPGSGRLAFDLLSELEQLGQLPEHYFLLEVSADLRQRQQHLLARFAPRVEWLDTLPASFSGLIIGNEVLDAMPVHLVAWGEDSLFERGVSMERRPVLLERAQTDIGRAIRHCRQPCRGAPPSPQPSPASGRGGKREIARVFTVVVFR